MASISRPKTTVRQRTHVKDHKKQRRKEARSQLKAVLALLQSGCKQIETLEEWERHVKPLTDWLGQHRDVLSPKEDATITRVIGYMDTAQKVIDAAAAGAAAIANELLLYPQDITLSVVVTNRGCPPINFTSSFASLANVSLPGPIAANSTVTETITTRAKAVDVAAGGTQLSVTMLGVRLLAAQTAGVKTISVDDSPLNAKRSFAVESGARHTVVIACQ